eukprot:m.263535 g.263535  ORF g.263535 m.263535 type:complete len:110 (-) comp16227_c0_seq43:129-458(-)
MPSLPSGTNNIGDVDVLSLPSLPAGTNNIGDIDILTIPVVGSHGNTSNAVTTSGTNETSTSIDCQYVGKLWVFGSTSAMCSQRQVLKTFKWKSIMHQQGIIDVSTLILE